MCILTLDSTAQRNRTKAADGGEWRANTRWWMPPPPCTASRSRRAGRCATHPALPRAMRPVSPAPRQIAVGCPGRDDRCAGNAARSGSRPPAIRRAGHRRRHRRPAGALISRRGSRGSSPSVRRDAMVNPAS